MNRAGLKKVVKAVRGKKGMVQRSYWVKAKEAVRGAAKKVGGFVGRHKGKIAAGAALAGTAILAHKYGAHKAFSDLLRRHRESKERGILLAKRQADINATHEKIQNTAKQQDAAQARIDHNTTVQPGQIAASQERRRHLIREGQQIARVEDAKWDHIEQQAADLSRKTKRIRRKKAN